MRKLIIAALLLLCSAVTSNATTYVENFETSFPTWETGWLGTNSNLKNYYGVGTGRGNNPDGLWIGNTPIIFNSSFGALITSFSIDVASWSSTPFNVYDMQNRIIFSSMVIPNYGAFTDPGTYQHFAVTSTTGISKFEFSGYPVVGWLSIDNVFVSTNDTAPVPEPGTMMLLGLGMFGLAIYGKRRKSIKA